MKVLADMRDAFRKDAVELGPALCVAHVDDVQERPLVS